MLVLSNTATSVNGLGAGLIANDKPPQPLPSVMEIFALVVVAAGAFWTIWRARRATRRSELIVAGLDLITVALITAMISPWIAIPGWTHGIALGLGAGGLLLGVRGARPRAWWGPRPVSDKIQVGISAVLLLVVLGLLVA